MEDSQSIFGLLMAAGAVLVPLMLFVQYIRGKGNNNPKLDPPAEDSNWEFGDEWKNVPEEIDLTDWEELFTSLSSQSQIAPKRGPDNNLLDDVPDLQRVQEILFDHGIQSKIGRSRQTSFPADAVFVEKKDLMKAQQILKTADQNF